MNRKGKENIFPSTEFVNKLRKGDKHMNMTLTQ